MKAIINRTREGEKCEIVLRDSTGSDTRIVVDELEIQVAEDLSNELFVYLKPWEVERIVKIYSTLEDILYAIQKGKKN